MCLLKTGTFLCICLFWEVNTYLLNPIALRKAKIVYSFELCTILACLSAKGLLQVACLTEVATKTGFTVCL